MASAITFIVDRSTEIYKNLHWSDEIKVVDFRTGPSQSLNTYPQYSAVISNIGDGAVFVSNIIVYWRGGNIQFIVNKLIPPNDFSVVNDAKLDYGKFSTVQANTTGVPSDEIINNAWITGLGRNQEPTCFLASVYNENSADVDRMDSHYKAGGRRFILEPVDSYVEYFSSHTKRKNRIKFSAVVTFSRSTDDECQKIAIE